MTSSDPFQLERFVTAQAHDYTGALAEIRSGRKRSHWMWYVFPQFAGLGSSPTSQHFAIQSVAEARAYLGHPILGPRLREAAQAALEVEGRTAQELFGSPDDLKLRSCATLFAAVLPGDSVFQRLLDQYFAGEPDPRTVRLITDANAPAG